MINKEACPSENYSPELCNTILTLLHIGPLQPINAVERMYSKLRAHATLCQRKLGTNKTKYSIPSRPITTPILICWNASNVPWILWYNLKELKVTFSRYRPGVAQRVGTGITLLFHDRGTRRRWVVSSTPRPQFTPREWAGTHCTGGWVGPRAGLDGRKISSPPGFDPGPSSP